MDLANEYFQKAIDACNAQENVNQELVALLKGNQATILIDKEKYDEALEKCEEALKIRTKLFPPIHPSIANSYGTIGKVMYHKGSYKQAVEYVEKALQIDRQALPIDHPQTLLHESNLELYKKKSNP